MLRISIYAMLIVILTMAAASAQTDKPGLPGYSNAARTDLEKKNDRELDHAYESTIKGRPDAKKTLIHGPMSGQPHQRRQRKSKNECPPAAPLPSLAWRSARAVTNYCPKTQTTAQGT
jgi:hypothetical protein